MLLSCHKLEFNMQHIINELGNANAIYLKSMNEFRSERIAAGIFNREELNVDYSLIENNSLADKLSRLSYWKQIAILGFN